MKIFYFDTETTGTNPIKNDIVQLAFIITVGGVVVEKHSWNCQPFSYENITEEALSVNGLTIEKIKNFQQPQEMYKDLIEIFSKHVDKYNKTDKMYPAGYNVNFDLDFIANFFKKVNKNTESGTLCILFICSTPPIDFLNISPVFLKLKLNNNS